MPRGHEIYHEEDIHLSIDLPEPIAEYFGAGRGNADAVARSFASNAVVKDEGHTYTGVEAIRKWTAEASAKYHYTAEAVACERQGGRTLVMCRLTGAFPGSPVTLRYFFRLERGKIVLLEIIP